MEAVSRYTKQYYEDVAKVLFERLEGPSHQHMWAAAIEGLAQDFADLFAADNLPLCQRCDIPHSVHYIQREGLHEYTGGFKRDDFLAACGLKPQSEQAYSDYVAGKTAGEFE